MLQFYADAFTDLIGFLAASEAKLSLEKRENSLSQAGAIAIHAKLSTLGQLCAAYGFKSIAHQCQRMTEHLQKRAMNISCGDMRDSLKQLRERREDELKSVLFLHLDPKQAEEFKNPSKDWDEVIGIFTKVRYNIEESAKCFALERYGASVFHVLQVAEYGVIQVAKLLQVAGDKPGWGSLKRLADLIKEPYPKRSALAQKHSKLLENVVPLAIVVKDSWRHKLDHVDNQIVWVDTDFSPMVAGEIISATRAFMRKLALELPH